MNRREFIKGTLLAGAVASTGVVIGNKLATPSMKQVTSKASKAELWLLNTGKKQLGNSLTQNIMNIL